MGQRTLLDKVFKGLDHNRYTALLGGAGLAAAGWLAGCQSTAVSPYTGEAATAHRIEQQRAAFVREQELERLRQEMRLDAAIEKAQAEYLASVRALTAEFNLGEHERAELVTVKAEQAAIAIEEIERSDEMKLALFDAAQNNPVVQAQPALAYAVGVFGTLLGLGVGVDNRRKDKVMAEYKAQIKGAPPHAHATDGAAS